MERESTENRAGRIVSRRRVNPIFPVPPIRASCISLFSVLPLSRLSVCSESPLLRISPRGRISLYSYRILYSEGVGFLTQNLPLSVAGSGRWQTPLMAILHGPRTSRFGLLFDQSRSCARQLRSIPYFDSRGHVAPQNFAVGFAPSRYACIRSFYFMFDS